MTAATAPTTSKPHQRQQEHPNYISCCEYDDTTTITEKNIRSHSCKTTDVSCFSAKGLRRLERIVHGAH
eukprot:1825681-Amphidinium_carterae.1